MKKTLNKLLILIFSILYGRQYIRGKQFNNLGGVKACWRFWFDQKIKGYNRHCPFPVNLGNRTIVWGV